MHDCVYAKSLLAKVPHLCRSSFAVSVIIRCVAEIATSHPAGARRNDVLGNAF